jgi:hypothetical protein
MEEVTEQLITKSLLFETWREYEDVRETWQVC